MVRLRQIPGSMLHSLKQSWRRFRAFHGRQHPLDVAVVYVAIILAASVLLFPPSPVPESAAVGDHLALNVLGPDNFTNADDILDVTGSIGGELRAGAFDATDGVVYFQGIGTGIYRCEISTDCDELSDWLNYSFNGRALYHESSGHLLFSGSAGGGVISRCVIADTDCDDPADWSTSYDTPDSQVAGFAAIGGILYAGVQELTNDTVVYYCDVSTTCDDSTDWAALNFNGRIRGLFADTGNSVLYAFFEDSGAGSLLRCDFAADGCDDATEFDPVLGTTYGTTDMTLNETDDRLYLSDWDDGSDGNVYQCATSTGCDDASDWVTISDGRGGSSLLWDSVNNVVFSGNAASSNLYRCDESDDCDGNWKWEIADTAAGAYDMVEDTTNQVIYLATDQTNTAIYRCELSDGCDASEQSSPLGIAHDTVNGRIFVSDYSNHRVLVYTDGLPTDGQAPHAVLGSTDFSCATSSASMCSPWGLAYDPDNERLFVADQGNDRVLVYDVNDVLDGEPAVNVLGQADFITNGCPSENDASDVCDAYGLAYSADNDVLYVVDGNMQRVLQFDGSAISDNMDATFVLGQPNMFTSGSGLSSASFNTPHDVALDDAGDRLFVADNANSRVLVFDVASVSNGEGAVNVIGQTDFVSNSGVTTADGLNNPRGAAYDSASDVLYVVDTGNNRVTAYDASALSDGMDAFDVHGQSGFTGSGNGTSQSQLDSPNMAYFDTADSILYISDSANNRTMLFEPAATTPATSGTHTATDLIGQVNAGTNDFTSSLRDGFDGRRRPRYIVDIVLDDANDRLFVAEYGRVLVFELDASHNLLDTEADAVLGQTEYETFTAGGASQTTFYGVEGIAYDSSTQRLFVTDSQANRVLVFDVAVVTDGEAAVNVLGQTDFTSTTGGTDQDSLFLFTGKAVVDEVGQRLFVEDYSNNRVMVFDIASITDGEPAVNVLGKDDFTGGGGGVDQDGLSGPQGMAFDAAGNRLFVSDRNANRIMVWDVAAITNGEDAVSVLGQPDFTSNANGAGTAAGLYLPSALAYDSNNDRLMAYDSGSRRIVIYDTAVIADGEAAVNVLGQPDLTTSATGYGAAAFVGSSGDRMAMRYDPANDRLYAGIAFSNVYRRFDLSSVTDGEGPLDYEGSANAAGLLTPQDVALDADNDRLFVADSSNNRVLVYNLTTNHQLVDATADAVLGQSDFVASFPGLSSASLRYPVSLAYESAENRLYVSDQTNHRVLVFDTTSITNGEPAMYALGQPDFVTDSNALTQSGMYQPQGMDVDDSGNRLFVSDAANARVLVHNVASASIANGQNADNVLGQTDFVSSGTGTSQSALSNPWALKYDAGSGRLFVGDMNNCRVMVFDATAITDGENAANVLGQTTFTGSGCGADEVNPQGDFTGLAFSPAQSLLFGSDEDGHRVMVWDVAAITNGEAITDVYGQTSFTATATGSTNQTFQNPFGSEYDDVSETLYIADSENNRVLIFGTTAAAQSSSSGGKKASETGFTPLRILVNRDDSVTDSRNVLVTIYAENTDTFNGTVDVVLSNDPTFRTSIPFRYAIPERGADGKLIRNPWPKTVAWDMCFGIPAGRACEVGRKTVYARFYVNVPAPEPVLVPPGAENIPGLLMPASDLPIQ